MEAYSDLGQPQRNRDAREKRHPTSGLEGMSRAEFAKQLHAQLKGSGVLGNVKVTDAEIL
jgi:hypothetical protein